MEYVGGTASKFREAVRIVAARGTGHRGAGWAPVLGLLLASCEAAAARGAPSSVSTTLSPSAVPRLGCFSGVSVEPAQGVPRTGEAEAERVARDSFVRSPLPSFNPGQVGALLEAGFVRVVAAPAERSAELQGKAAWLLEFDLQQPTGRPTPPSLPGLAARAFALVDAGSGLLLQSCSGLVPTS